MQSRGVFLRNCLIRRVTGPDYRAGAGYRTLRTVIPHSPDSNTAPSGHKHSIITCKTLLFLSICGTPYVVLFCFNVYVLHGEKGRKIRE